METVVECIFASFWRIFNFKKKGKKKKTNLQGFLL